LNQHPPSPIQQQCTHYDCCYHRITLHISLFRHISSLTNNKCHLIHHPYAPFHLNGRTMDILSFSLLCRFLFSHRHSHPLAYDIHQPPFLTPPYHPRIYTLHILINIITNHQLMLQHQYIIIPCGS
jgi:hypothetical protein